MDIVENAVFTDRHLHENDVNVVRLVFMPIMFGALEDVNIDELGMVYEYYSKSFSRSINGYPMFFSFGMLNKEDAEITWRFVQEIEIQRQEFLDVR